MRRCFPAMTLGNSMSPTVIFLVLLSEKLLEDVDGFCDEGDFGENRNLENRGGDHDYRKNDDSCSLDFSEDQKRDQNFELLFSFLLLATSFHNCERENIVSLNVNF